jgi:3-methyladenine DNA glycosylase AlkD
MTRTEAMKELRANGSAQTRKTYRRHGMQGDMFGVSYAVLGKMKKKIKVDQPLADQLWATGNCDARVLATMIADPATIGVRTLNVWAGDLEDSHMAAALSNVAAEAPSARKQMEKWTAASDEMIGCAGWHTLASMARQNNGLPDAFFEKHLGIIESRIQSDRNWVKYAMNNALINIGVRNPKLERKAIATARRIGRIEVDHGETGCKTPDAIPYIKKTIAHRKKKAQKAGQERA